MRYPGLLLIGSLAFGANEKLTPEQRIELIRGLSAEFATVKVMLPRSKKALEYDIEGKSHKEQWDAAARERGPAARAGDQIQFTKVEIDNDKITFEINGGLKSGAKWYDHVQVGMGNGGQASRPSGGATLGTTLVVRFAKGVPAVDSAERKKILKPLFDFDKK